MKYKQSSVDFYAEKSLDLFNLFQQGSISINDFRARMLIIEIEAKEMEKEQIVNTWSEATAPQHEIGLSDASYVIAQIKKAEQYYEQTYGGNNHLCCTPEGQIKRYVNCIGCDRKPLTYGGNK